MPLMTDSTRIICLSLCSKQGIGSSDPQPASERMNPLLPMNSQNMCVDMFTFAYYKREHQNFYHMFVEAYKLQVIKIQGRPYGATTSAEPATFASHLRAGSSPICSSGPAPC